MMIRRRPVRISAWTAGRFRLCCASMDRVALMLDHSFDDAVSVTGKTRA